MNVLATLLAKTGAATLTTKVLVAAAVSAAAVGTAGATGVVPAATSAPDAALVTLGRELLLPRNLAVGCSDDTSVHRQGRPAGNGSQQSNRPLRGIGATERKAPP